MKIAVEWEHLCKEEWWNMFPSWSEGKHKKFHKDTVSLEKGGRHGGVYNSEMIVLCSAFLCLWNDCMIHTSSWGKHSVLGNCYYSREPLWPQEDFLAWFKPSYSELHILLFHIKGMTCWFQPATILFPFVAIKTKVKSNLILSKDGNLKLHFFL